MLERGSLYEHVLNEETWNAACIPSHRDKDSAQQMADRLIVKMKEQIYSYFNSPSAQSRKKIDKISLLCKFIVNE